MVRSRRKDAASDAWNMKSWSVKKKRSGNGMNEISGDEMRKKMRKSWRGMW